MEKEKEKEKERERERVRAEGATSRERDYLLLSFLRIVNCEGTKTERRYPLQLLRLIVPMTTKAIQPLRFCPMYPSVSNAEAKKSHIDEVDNCQSIGDILITSVFSDNEDVYTSISRAADSIGLQEIPSIEVIMCEQYDWIKNTKVGMTCVGYMGLLALSDVDPYVLYIFFPLLWV
ncbi:ribosomal protein L11 methyltransferase [Cinnamomum micranthum f. kanehirae]|uniref:Ribosomal protein L11 methyltransferase n=1 Tax=Cinnamomum micranthum f. kanehirae TaxID=337451 RepID=A0A443PRG2_9MAGN|nr:ribosomal protein L11 methyltransferase [Cinnamomum micranthum f. kanehirae]